MLASPAPSRWSVGSPGRATRCVATAAPQTVYRGPASGAVDHFRDCGFECPPYSNPSDYFMRVPSCPAATLSVWVWHASSPTHAGFLLPSPEQVLSNRTDGGAADIKKLVDAQAGKAKGLLEAPATPADNKVYVEVDDTGDVEAPAHRPSWTKELWDLTVRSWRMAVRNPVVVRARFAQIIIMALFFGAVYIVRRRFLPTAARPAGMHSHAPSCRPPLFSYGAALQPLGTTQASIQSRNGVLFLVATSMVFTSVSSIILTFPIEKLLVIRDMNSGMYRVWTFYLSKILADFPISTALPLLFSLILYWFVGLSNTAAQFFLFFFICWITIAVASSMGLMIGSAFTNAEVAVSVMPMVLVPLMLFAGLFVNLGSIPAWIAWIQWLSIYKWAYEAYEINEYTGLTLTCTPEELVPVSPGVSVCPITSGEQELKLLNFTSSELWIPLVVMVGMMVVFRVLSLLFLQAQIRKLQKHSQ